MKLLLVAGMHRSGTSFLAELLDELGVGMGSDLLPAAEDNPHGFFEHADVKRINDQVLERLGASWDDPPVNLSGNWAASAGLDRVRREAEAVLVGLAEEVDGAPAMAVKDPRLSLMGQFWTGLSRATASYVLVRDPRHVAESLRHRNGMSETRSLDLWTRYTIDAVLDLPNPCLVSLDALSTDPEASVRRLAEHAGLDVDLASAIELARERSRAWEPPELLASTTGHESVAAALHLLLADEPDAVAVRPVLAQVARAWRGPVDDVELERVRRAHGDDAVGAVVEASRERTDKLKAQITDLGLQLDETRRERDQERRAKRGLEARVQGLEEARDTASSSSATAERQRDEARSQLEKLRAAARRDGATRQRLSDELVATEARLGEAEGRAARLEDELSSRPPIDELVATEARLGEAEGRAARLEDELSRRPPVDESAREELERLKSRRSVRAALGTAQTLRPVFRTVRRVRRRTSSTSGRRGGDRGDDSAGGAPAPAEAPAAVDAPEAPAVEWVDESRWGSIDWLGTAQRLQEAPPLTVVVPIFDAVDDVRAGLDRLFAWTPASIRILLVDDASTDPAIAEMLAGIDPRTNVTVLRNDQNLGFTRTVNRAFAATDGDVVLLNSDARVTPNWTTNLRVAAYATPMVATVSAVSDNAGAFSVPEPGANPATGLAEVDHARLLTRASPRRWIHAPTGHGFCMLVRRDALDSLGEFDAEAFPRGYGEENDFCMRARAAGFVNVVDDATLVFHANAASFDPSRKEELVAAGRLTVDARHPDYTTSIHAWLRGDMQQVRADVREVDAQARVLAAGDNPRVRPRLLSVVQRGAGGTPATNEDLMRALEDRWDPWILTSDSRRLRLQHVVDGQVETVEIADMGTRVGFNSPSHPTYLAFVLRVLVTLGIELVHVRHLVKHTQQDLPNLLRALGTPSVLSFHDFYWVCPNVHLLDREMTFCGGRCTADEGDCSRVFPGEPLVRRLKHDFVLDWQRNGRALLSAFDGFVTTSGSARDVLVDNLPELAGRDLAVIPHGRDLGDAPVVVTEPEPDQVRIAVLGSITPPKGGEVLRELLAADHDDVLDVHVVGPHDPQYDDLRVTFHGAYQREQLTRILDGIRPSFAAVLSVWPETWSHTLTEAWAHGLPVLTSSYGALGERIDEHGGGWVIDVDDPAHALEQVRAIAADTAGWRAQQRRATVADLPTTGDMADDYDRAYQRARTRAAPDLPVVDVHVMTDRLGSSPGSAHIRTLSRFRHPAVRTRLRARREGLGGAHRDKLGPADMLWVQRNGLPPDDVEVLLDRRRAQDAALVVDLDDDLVNPEQLPPELVDYVPVMRRLVTEADVVFASTPALAAVLEPLASRVEVLPNQLDEHLWFPGGDACALRPQQPDGRLDLLYMGTRTHAADLDFFRAPFERFAAEHDGEVVLHVIGGTPEGDDEWFRRINISRARRHFRTFVPWLRRLAPRFDLAVAPLLDTSFNTCKSDLKYLEYAAMGLPSVCSRVPAYADTVTHGVDGRLADETVEDWVANLHALAAPDHRRRAAAAAMDHAQRRTLGNTVENFADILVDLAGTRGRRPGQPA